MSDASDPLSIEKASPTDEVEALRIAFSNLSSGELEIRVAQSLQASADDPPADLWVARRGPRIVAAMRLSIEPGRTATISPPRVVADEPPKIAAELLRGVAVRLVGQGVQWAQALLALDHTPDARMLAEAGFRHISNLLYLVSVRGAFPTSEPRDGLEWISYSAGEHARFAQIVRQTYVGSRDFPQLDGIRDIEDVLRGYRANGVFDPSRWIIARHRGTDIGCLLLADDPSNKQWELTYLGLIAVSRRQGHGLALTRYAQWLAGRAGRERLVLAVDAANEPALATYAAAGFVAWDHRSVFVRIF